MARTGGAAAYGAVGALLGLSALGGFVATGNQYAVARMTASSDIPPAVLVVRGLRAVSPWLLPAGALLALAGPGSAFLRLRSVLPVVFGVLLFGAIVFGSAISGVLVGLRRFRVIAVLNVTTMVVRVGLGLLFLPGHDAVTYALGLSLIATVSTSVLAAAFVFGRGGGDSTPTASPAAGIATEGLTSSLLAGALWATWSLPVVFARHALAPHSSGGFAATQLVAGGLILLLSPLAMAFFPTIARYGSRRTISAGLAGTVGIGLLGAITFGVAGPWLIARMYGTGFAPPTTLAFLLGVSALSVATANYCVWAARATQRHPRALLLGAATALLAEAALALAAQGSTTWLATTPCLAVAAGAVVATTMSWAGRRGPLARARISADDPA